jgi:transposase
LDLHANHSSQIAGQALSYFATLYDIERHAAVLDAKERHRVRQSRAKPVCDALYEWDGGAAHAGFGRCGDCEGAGLQP